MYRYGYMNEYVPFVTYVCRAWYLGVIYIYTFATEPSRGPCHTRYENMNPYHRQNTVLYKALTTSVAAFCVLDCRSGRRCGGGGATHDETKLGKHYRPNIETTSEILGGEFSFVVLHLLFTVYT